MAYVEPYAEPTTPPPPAAPPPPARPAPPPRRYLSERQAVDVAFQIAQDRGLDVERVRHAHLDGAGRWHVELGGRDRANLVLDARDGRLLKGQFKQRGHGHGHGHGHDDDDQGEEWDD